jgi:hypothetical protein
LRKKITENETICKEEAIKEKSKDRNKKEEYPGWCITSMHVLVIHTQKGNKMFS